METIKLDLIPGKKMPSLHASQYDDGRDYHIDLTENRVPYTLDGTETISLTVRKCDNTLVTMDIANTFADKSYIEFRTTEQMNACAGFNYGEITIEKNGTQISSLNFYLQVEGAPDEGGITSQSEINNLNRQINDYLDDVLPDAIAEDVPPIVERVIGENYYDKEATDEKYATKTELSNKADVSAIPTKTSQLQNDSGFVTSSDIPTKTSQLQNDSGFATTSDIAGIVEEVAEPIVERLVPIAVGDNYYDKTAIDNKLDPINTALNNKVDNSVLVHNKNAESLWEVGSIAYNDGHNESKTTRLRTKTYIDRNAQISVASGYLYELVAYNKGTYVGIWNGSTFAKAEAWNSGDKILGELGSYDYRLVMSKATPETETTSDYNKVSIITITDATGTTYGIPADAGKTGEDISTLKGGLDDIKSEVLIEKPALEYNGYILSSTGNVSSSSYGKCTDFIDIGKFDRVDWNTANGSASVARVAFYDENKAYLSALTVNDGTSGTLDLSDDSYASAKFVRLTYYDYPGKDLSGYNGRLYKSDSIAKSTEVLNKLNGIDRGVNVLIFGDSITDCASFTIVNDKTTVYNMAGTNSYVDGEGHTITYKMWAKMFGEFIPCAEIRNYACSGASYQDQVSPSNPRKDLSYQMTLALNDLDNPNGTFVVDDFVPDVIIFALGTNDGQPDDTPADAYAKIVTTASGIDIDATLSALDKSKFCEAVLWAYFTARKNFPYALIMNVLPLQRMSDENPTGELHTYLQEISQKYGGAVIIDGAYESGIVRENNVKSGLGATLKDGLHPNEKGQNMLARLIIGKYKSYYVPFDYMNP